MSQKKDMKIETIKTLGDLKSSGYQSKSIKDELRYNLISKIQKKETTFKGVHGYENTVIPELERAILSRHNINLLGCLIIYFYTLVIFVYKIRARITL